MLIEIDTNHQSFAPYRKLTPEIYKKAKLLSKKLRGFKVIHVNATALGGGVAEILKSQVPLENDLGLDSRWFVIKAEPEFFKVTKKIHNLLQGKEKSFLSESDKKTYIATTKKISRDFAEILSFHNPDVVIIHDPQPIPLLEAISPETATILRLHIDLSTPDKDTFNFLKPFIQKFDKIILTAEDYMPSWLSSEKVNFMTPTIDPFSHKNRKMDLEKAREILTFYNIHTDKHLVTQVSRFDPWKDPMGVIQAYYHAKNEIPDLQLILSGIMEAADDPEARGLFAKIKKHCSGDPNIFLFANADGFKEISVDTFVNAIQTASDVIVQKSIREGFGMVVTEAMWKGKAVVGGDTVGIGLQITDGINGYLVSSPEEAAHKIVKLIKDPHLRLKIGKAARRTVQEKFLHSRLVYNHLKLYNEFKGKK